MKKKSVRLLVSVAVLGILGVGYAGVRYYVKNEEKKEEEAEEKEAEDISIFSAPAENLESVKFFVEEKEVTFDYDKEKDLWTRRGEKDFPVNQDKMSEAAGAISGLNAERVLENVENLAEYGLDSPQNTVTVDAGEENFTMRIGDYNEGVSQYYIACGEDDKTVYLVSGALVEPFLGGLYDYAKKEDFPAIESSNISSILVDGKENSYILKYQEEDSVWEISANGRVEKADSAKAAGVTSSISALEYFDFVDYQCTDLEKYGLKEPYATITVDYKEEEETEENEAADSSEGLEDDTSKEESTEEKEESEPIMVDRQLVLHIGDQGEEATRYAVIEGSDDIYTISEELLAPFLNETVESYWDLSLGYKVLNQVEKVEIVYENESHTINVSRETFESEDEETQEEMKYLLDGEKLDDTTELNTFWNKLTNMYAQKILTDKYIPETEAEMKTKVISADGTVMEAAFYSYDTNFYAVVIENNVYLVNKVNVKDMFEAYENLVAGEEG